MHKKNVQNSSFQFGEKYINEKPEEPKVGDIFVTTDDNEAVLKEFTNL